MDILTITILAGGLGKRMQSPLPKVLQCIKKEPMIVKIIKEAQKLNPIKIFIIVGKFKDIIKTTIEQFINYDKLEYVIQDPPLGTGHAVLSSLNYLPNNNGINLILNGDTPLLTYQTLQDCIQNYINNKFQLQITAIHAKNPKGCGRIILQNDEFKEIREEKDCSELEKKINLINCGIYLSEISLLKKYVPLIDNKNSQNEFYLTDLVDIYIKSTNNKVGLFVIDKEKEIEISNVNTREDLDYLESILNNILDHNLDGK